MKHRKIYIRTLVCIFPFALAALLYFSARFVADSFTLPPCFTYAAFGIYCPGCGLTRSVIALINGDILLSLRQNAIPVFAILVFAVFYVELALRTFGLNVRFPIHSTRLLYAVLILWGAYSVLRNIVPCLMPV